MLHVLPDYQSPLPNKPLSETLPPAIAGASTGILLYFPLLKAAQYAKVKRKPYIQSLITLFHEATKKPIRTMYGPFPWGMIREAQWLTKYPFINWVHQKLESHVPNSHLSLFFASSLVALQEWGFYGVGDYLYTTHEISKANNWTLSTKEHLDRALRSKRMGAITYIATNTIWQFMTMDGISMFQQSLPDRVKRSVPKEILLPTSIFFPTLFATIIMTPFNTVKTVTQISSKENVLRIIEAVNKLNFRGLYKGSWPTILLATVKITTGLSIATMLNNKKHKN